MLNSVHFAQPDVTLRLDMSGIIRRASLSTSFSKEGTDVWVGRPWADTVVGGGNAQVLKMLEDARITGVSSFHQVRQRFPSGLELPVEYTTVRLGGNDGLLAIGRSLEAVSELRSGLLATQRSMERDSWKLRDVEMRYRLLFDASSQPVLMIGADDTRILEANPAAVRALGAASQLLPEILPAERDVVRAMLARVCEQGKAPGVVVHVGAGRKPFLVRASLIAVEPAVFMIQLSPAGVAPVDPIDIDSPGAGVNLAEIMARMPVGKAKLRDIVQEAVASVERSCIQTALRIAQGNRTAAARLLGLSRQGLYVKLGRYSLDPEDSISPDKKDSREPVDKDD